MSSLTPFISATGFLAIIPVFRILLDDEEENEADEEEKPYDVGGK